MSWKIENVFSYSESKVRNFTERSSACSINSTMLYLKNYKNVCTTFKTYWRPVIHDANCKIIIIVASFVIITEWLNRNGRWALIHCHSKILLGSLSFPKELIEYKFDCFVSRWGQLLFMKHYSHQTRSGPRQCAVRYK